MNRRQEKPRPTGGADSNAWKVWNEHHPDDPIVPGDGCVIHHKDENPWNDDPDNLQKMTDEEHRKHHTSNGRHPNQGRKFSKELRRKLSDAHKGHAVSEETRQKLSDAGRGNQNAKGGPGFVGRHSEESKRKMSEAKKGRVPWNKGLRHAKKV